MNDSERIREVERFLHLSTRALAFEIGLKNPQTLYDIHKGKHGISKSVAADITAKYLNIDYKWLLTGEGEMLRPSAEESGKAAARCMIRYWRDVEATGGGVESFWNGDGTWSEMVIPDFSDCTDAMTLIGDSMYPRYKSGQILIFREWRENFIEYGQAYLIVTDAGHRMLKYLRPSQDPGKLVCVSENSDRYPPFEIDRSSIVKLYVVKGSIERNMF